MFYTAQLHCPEFITALQYSTHLHHRPAPWVLTLLLSRLAAQRTFLLMRVRHQPNDSSNSCLLPQAPPGATSIIRPTTWVEQHPSSRNNSTHLPCSSSNGQPQLNLQGGQLLVPARAAIPLTLPPPRNNPRSINDLNPDPWSIPLPWTLLVLPTTPGTEWPMIFRGCR